MKEPIKLTLGSVLIEIWPDKEHLRHTFPDGSTLTASPEATDGYRSHAKELGYRSTWLCCLHHEILHQMYMQELGLPFSFSLHAAALELEFEPHHYEEEETVLMLQKWLTTGDETVLKYPCKLEYPLAFRDKVMRIFEMVQRSPEAEYNSYEF